MPDEVNFAVKIAPEIKDFHIESSRLILGEGVPVVEFTLAHLVAPHKIVLRIIPSVDAFTEGKGNDGIVNISVIASPRLRVSMTNMQTQEEVKLG